MDSDAIQYDEFDVPPRAWAGTDATSVRLMARAAQLSVRRVETVFDKHVGLAPKSLMRLSRFQQALAMLRRTSPMGIGRIAARCGYHDHAHFVRECQQFAGVAPTVVASRREHLGDAFIDSRSSTDSESS